MNRDVDLSHLFPLERLVRRWPRASFVAALLLLPLCSTWIPLQ